MKIAIMQPYFFPYIGYFQLMHAVDEFVVYDNIEYTKKGWINRNRILLNGSDAYITLPLKKDSDYLHIKDRYLSENWDLERNKMINRIHESYHKAPYFQNIFPLLQSCILNEERNLFQFIFYSLKRIKEYLNISAKLIISSNVQINHNLKGTDKVLSICKKQAAKTYINPIGGTVLYDSDIFKSHGLELFFLKTNNFKYLQYKNDFIPCLSIIDILMFNSIEETQNFLKSDYTLN